ERASTSASATGTQSKCGGTGGCGSPSSHFGDDGMVGPMQAPSPAPELVLEALGRVLATTRFATSESRRSLLRYTGEKALAGLGSELKEYSIGVETLGRPPSFDPTEDNIVRVQARKLRQRLAGYYDTEGSQNRCRIVFQPGSYVPSFHLA